MKVTIEGASLTYGVSTGDLRGGGEARVASRPDRALLRLTGVEAQWPDIMHNGYVVKPEDALLTLEDGTEVTPQAIGDDLFSNFLPDILVWEVPADLKKATLTIKPSPAEDYYTLDFQGGSIEIPLAFGG